jgi:hypothetical protein
MNVAEVALPVGCGNAASAIGLHAHAHRPGVTHRCGVDDEQVRVNAELWVTIAVAAGESEAAGVLSASGQTRGGERRVGGHQDPANAYVSVWTSR